MKGTNVCKEQERKQEDMDAEEQEVFARIKVELGDSPTLVKCAEQYFLVKKCWNDYDECLRINMTFERACHTLREVRDQTWGKPGGTMLSLRAHKLLWEIVDKSAVIPDIEDQIVSVVR